ncbi:MAG: alpha/beta hydrolase [Acidimicrobiia bacterium]|nr:alpha/beta hydrolase [Acidimicrobiia bacterium]
MFETSLSNEAQTWLATYPRDDGARVDFSNIDAERESYLNGCSDASDRAIARHQLTMNEVELGGVRCQRVTSGAAPASRGTLFYVFGGAFIMGSPRADLPIIGALANYCGLDVIAPWYRLAPEHPAPAALHDCLAAYEAATSGLAGPLFLAGESAGGNLALLVAQRAAASQLRTPDAMALLSPAVDLRVEEELFVPVWGSDPTLHPARMLDVLDAYVAGSDPSEPDISPLFGSMENLPPTIITTGTRDQLVNMCVRLHRKMRRSGLDVRCNVWDGLWHVFEFYDEYPEADESLREIAAFLNRQDS